MAEGICLVCGESFISKRRTRMYCFKKKCQLEAQARRQLKYDRQNRNRYNFYIPVEVFDANPWQEKVSCDGCGLRYPFIYKLWYGNSDILNGTPDGFPVCPVCGLVGYPDFGVDVVSMPETKRLMKNTWLEEGIAVRKLVNRVRLKYKRVDLIFLPLIRK